MSENTIKLRELILNTKKPIVLKNFKTKWKCAEGSLDDWCQQFDAARNGAKMDFEQMLVKSETHHPQWERERRIVQMTMREFLLEHKDKNQDFWTGLNYKTPDEIPKECKVGVDFSCLGFPHLTDDYARFWLSSGAANTPCHQDTYGCNVVVQIFGSKSWLLFPPKTSLTSTRVPYEESSIYCLENFYAPTPEQVSELKRFKSDVYMCQLDAGDVLIVPRQWWHFVEAVELSLSINAWIPLNVDVQAQFEECIVKYLIETIVRGGDDDAGKHLLNPNQESLSAEDEVLTILAFLRTKLNVGEKKEKNKEISYPYQYLEEEKVELLMHEIQNARFVERASSCDYEALIERNATRFVASSKDLKASPISNIKEALVNSICSPKAISEIAREFKKRYNQFAD